MRIIKHISFMNAHLAISWAIKFDISSSVLKRYRLFLLSEQQRLQKMLTGVDDASCWAELFHTSSLISLHAAAPIWHPLFSFNRSTKNRVTPGHKCGRHIRQAESFRLKWYDGSRSSPAAPSLNGSGVGVLLWVIAELRRSPSSPR